MSPLRSTKLIVVLFLVALVPTGAMPAMAQQGDQNQAAIVVRFSDESVVSRCVSFNVNEISGLELLERSGLESASSLRSGGNLICSIEETGCPVDDCFCQCTGGPDCTYWSYWHLRDGTWAYSVAGAASHKVVDGAIEGWSWGPGTVDQAKAPPLAEFVEICGDAASTISDEAASGNDSASEGGDGEQTIAYFGLFALLLTLLLVVVKRRS